jgi:hypothetical protein
VLSVKALNVNYIVLYSLISVLLIVKVHCFFYVAGQ